MVLYLRNFVRRLVVGYKTILERTRTEAFPGVPPIPVGPVPPLPEVKEREKIEGFEIPKFIPSKVRIEAIKPEEKVPISLSYPLIPRKPAKGEPVFAYANIFWEPKTHKYIYQVIEPRLSEKLKHILEKVRELLEQKLDIDFSKLRKFEAVEFLHKSVDDILTYFKIRVSEDEKKILHYYVERDFIGLGRIEPFMRDPDIEDISCDGLGIPIFVFHRNPEIGSVITNVVYDRVDELDSFILRLAQLCGKSISVAEPLVGGSLPDGSRLQAALATDIARRGSNFCIKEGYVQLSDGSIEDIKDLFVKWKKIYGSKIDEYGNEIVNVTNEEIVGADEKNLKQECAKVIQIVKLKPPKNLVRVEFKEKGKTTSHLEVTKNHMFHVLTEDRIKTIPAEKLSKGMWVPAPAKIEINNSQKEYFKTFLIKSLLDFKKSRVYVKLDRNTLSLIRILKNKSRLKDVKRGKTKSIPLDEFLENMKLNRRNIKELNELRCILREGKKGRVSEIKIPLKLNEELSYLIGWVIGSGSLTKNNLSINVGLNKYYKKSILRSLKRVFDIEGKSYKNDPNRIYANSKILAKILHDCFSIPKGKKARDVDVPKIIERSSKKIVASFLRGLFESDGSFVNDINLTTFSEKLATKIIFLLARFGIYSSFNRYSNTFRVYVPSPYYFKFSEEICSNKQVQKLVKGQKTKASHILPSIILNPLYKEIKRIGILKKGYEILNFTEARKRRVVSFNKVRALNDLIKQYGKNEITSFIDRILNDDLEFKQIVNVETLENREPVYDIFCNPVSFYIGGKSSPLFLHDTIRKFTERPLTPAHLLNYNTLDVQLLAYLWLIVDYGKSILVSGGTASGKTTLLNVLSLFIRPEKKICSIEDTPELKLPHTHWVPHVARVPMAVEGKRRVGEVDLFDLLKESLRYRPDYIVVGEVRGKEAFVLFQEMATGHPSLATIHAENLPKLVDRLTTPPIDLPATLIGSLDLILFLFLARQKEKHVRRVSEALEIVGVDPKTKTPITNRVFKWNPVGDKFEIVGKSVLLKKISESTGLTEQQLKDELERRMLVLNWMKEKNIVDYEDVFKTLNMYYAYPERVLFAIKGEV